MCKKIVFLTGTRADFGKLKSLIEVIHNQINFEVHIFVTGMHMSSKYGKTVNEIYKSGFKNIFEFINHDSIDNMDRTLAKTIDGFSLYIKEIEPDLIVVHGDRVEALAGAIVGSLNNILVAHIEGGEVSGTIDELIRHSVSKLSHIHMVANNKAKKRLIQMGELEQSVFVIGSPDLDIMFSDKLADLHFILGYYQIPFEKYAIAIFHPITTEIDYLEKYIIDFVDVLLESGKNYIVIYPNNDLGSDYILKSYKILEKNIKFKIFPSIRFEYFIVLLKHANFIIGNSSVGIREAPCFGVSSIDIGSRQLNRAVGDTIIHSDYDKESIMQSIQKVCEVSINNRSNYEFGDGKSNEKFLSILNDDKLWQIRQQKQFVDIV